jgi:hypothetical protein
MKLRRLHSTDELLTRWRALMNKPGQRPYGSPSSYQEFERDLELLLGAAFRDHQRFVNVLLRDNLKDIRKNIAILWRKIEALSEKEALERFGELREPGFHAPIDTSKQDSRLTLLELLALTGSSNRRFLDIGCGRAGGQSGFLAAQLGWRGLFVDASEGAIEGIRKRFGDLAGVQALQQLVTPGNVNELAGSVGSGELDLVAIDIDSYDFWVWKALEATPSIVVIEYNAHFGLDSVVVPLDAIAAGSPNGYSGAGLAALAKLGDEKGYVLLGCDHNGANAYFGRADRVPASLAQAPEDAWRPSLSRYTVDDHERDSEHVRSEIRKRGLALVEV